MRQTLRGKKQSLVEQLISHGHRFIQLSESNKNNIDVKRTYAE